MNVMVNSHSEAYEINVSFSQGSNFVPTLFPFFINNLLRNILRSLVNLCGDANTVYGRTSKNQDDVSLANDLSSDLAVTTQR